LGAIDPIFGKAVPVCYGSNPDYRVTNNVGNEVREYSQVHTPVTAGAETWYFVICTNPCNVLIDFVSKSLAQTIQLAFVVSDGVQ
jgi:hypothetical protein